MDPNEDRIYLLQPPSTVQQERMLDPVHGGTKPCRIGRILAVPGLENETEEQRIVFFRPRARVWSGKVPPRYVTIGSDLRTVYTWPLEWLFCREFAFGRFVRRVGRLEAHQLIFDGEYFLRHIGVGVPN